MPWTALPFTAEGRAAGQRLSQRFSVRGIPHLALVDADGVVLNTNARGAVAADPAGAGFPWRGTVGAEDVAGAFSKPLTILLMFILAWVMSKYVNSAAPAR